MKITEPILIHSTEEIRLILSALKLLETNSSRKNQTSPPKKVPQTQKEAAANLRKSILTRIREGSSKKAERYRNAAIAVQKEGELEVDDGAIVSMGEDPGAYVMAWWWFYKTDLPKQRKESD